MLENKIKQAFQPCLQEQINIMQTELDKLRQHLNIDTFNSKILLTENAKKKLEYINGSCIVRNFPKEQPTKEWAGAVLDLLEELGLGNYR